jgi:hypothetical protein
MQNLAKYLSQMPGVAAVNMNLQVGQASLQWQPNAPFSMINLTNTVARSGAFLDNIHMRVRGTIQARGKDLILVSIGDNTPFVLLGPLQVIPGRNSDPFLIQSYPLTPFLISQLTLGMQQNQIALIEGPLYFWQGTHTIYLIIDKLSFMVSGS